jgi:hypothetical protein
LTPNIDKLAQGGSRLEQFHVQPMWTPTRAALLSGRYPFRYGLQSLRDGGLMSYGPDLKETVERAATMVDRLFKGTKPADLPFEEPTQYRFALNSKTAKAIALIIPPYVLAPADEVIE